MTTADPLRTAAELADEATATFTEAHTADTHPSDTASEGGETRVIEPGEDLNRIIESAGRLGVELDEEATKQWLVAIAAEHDEELVVTDADSGAFGHRVAMLDFSPRDLERLRSIGKIVEVTGPAPMVESALAISGSSAQSRIQSFPGDCDYFQRLNIRADTRDEACRVMADLLRDKALDTAQGPTYQFLDAKLGSYPFDCMHGTTSVRKGSPITWNLDEIEAQQVRLEQGDGTWTTMSWHEVALDPGWCKLDWVVSDPERRQLSNASNVIDVTWEAPDGEIVSLDGYLDAYFQEVYLDPESVPVFAKVAKFVSEDALDVYVERLEGEVTRFLTNQLNYGKAAKRMYNIFRLSGQHVEAAYVRELFDEPATILYQVWSLITTLDDATRPGSTFLIPEVQEQVDSLILDVISALEGAEETAIVKALFGLRRALEDQHSGQSRIRAVEAAQTQVINVVNTFFRERLVSMPTIDDYMSRIQGSVEE